MVKLFVGNLGDANSVTSNDLREQFERYGSVTECERVKNYAFVHMNDRSAAEQAQQDLNGTQIKGTNIRVEFSDRQQPRKSSIKLFVGNLSEGTTKEELRELFGIHAIVLEADVVKNFGFVHIDAEEGKNKVPLIIRELNDYNLNGNLIRVQQSTSTVRQRPGMQGDLCYRCGHGGHWSKECPKHSGESLNNDRGNIYSHFRQTRGLRHGSGIGPIRNSLASHADLYARTIGGSACNTFGGIPFSTRSAQNPYPQPLLPSYTWERNLFNTYNPTSLNFTPGAALRSGSMLSNGPGMSLAASYERYLPQSNPMLIPQQNARSSIATNSFLPSSHETISEQSGAESFVDSYGRFNSVQENERQKLNFNGMCYENFSNIKTEDRSLRYPIGNYQFM